MSDNTKFNVAQLMKESTGATRRFEIEHAGCLDDDSEFSVTGEVEFLRTKRGILVRGDFSGSVRMACSRCLTACDQAITFRLEEEFMPSVSVTSGTPLPGEDEPGAFTIDAHHMLDLEEPIRQYVLLAAPMKPLCRPDCRGLCPRCGTNLNEINCRCEPTNGNLPEGEIGKLRDLSRKLR